MERVYERGDVGGMWLEFYVMGGMVVMGGMW